MNTSEGQRKRWASIPFEVRKAMMDRIRPLMKGKDGRKRMPELDFLAQVTGVNRHTAGKYGRLRMRAIYRRQRVNAGILCKPCAFNNCLLCDGGAYQCPCAAELDVIRKTDHAI
jgi:hypothetical protein